MNAIRTQVNIRGAASRRGRWCQRLLLAVAVAVLAACATETARRESVALIMDGRYEEGLAQLEQLSHAEPKNGELRSTWLRQREQAVSRVLNAANSERANGRFDTAEAFYRRALAIEPANQAARDGLRELAGERRHATWLADAQAMQKKGDTTGARTVVGLILAENPAHVKANQIRYQIEQDTLRENVAGPRLNIKGRRPVTLQFRDANLKMVLEAISRTTGVNIVVDKDVRSDVKVTIFVKDTGVEETLDLILLQNQLEKRILGENTVLVYPLTPAKAKDYQELKVRRFALVNADPKQVQSMIKTILKTRDVYVDERSNAVVIRDTPQAIRLAERMVSAMDLPEPEVMLEVELLDIDRRRSLDLGLDLPTSFGAVWPISGTVASLANLRNINSAAIGVSGLAVAANARASDSDTRTLATPRIRVRNKEKAKILIGNRTPVISSAAVPGSGVTTNAVFNTSIQYLETGIKLEVEPTVYLDGNVAIKVNLEVSDLGEKEENRETGTVAYSTTTNNATTVLRLKDGETQVLGGLLRAFDSHGQPDKIAGLGNIPFLGRLFGTGSDSWQNRELVLAITPRIVRNNQVSEADLLELWSGTESNLNAFAPDLKVAASANVLSQSGSPAAAGTAPSGPGAGAAYAPPLAPPVAGLAPPPVPSVPPLATATTALAVQLNGPAQARVGERISVAIDAHGGAVRALALSLIYDSEVLRAVAVSEGDLMRRAGLAASFESNIDESAGRVSATLTAETGSASGTGRIASVQFEVVSAQRPALVGLASINASSDGNSAVQVMTPPGLSIAIQP